MHFADALIEKVQKTSPIVVGLDPNFDLMPEYLIPKTSSQSAVKRALIAFSKIVIESTYDLVPAVKLQSAYYEQFGTAGIDALSEAIHMAKSKGLLVIMDGKRGDIGSTSMAYAKAYLQGSTILKNGTEIPSDLDVDCLTISPFLGDDSLSPFVEIAVEKKKGLFLLVKTSNPGSKLFLDHDMNGKPVYHHLAELVTRLGTQSGAIGSSGYSCIGAVVGATVSTIAKELRELMPKSFILMPGVGAQGGEMGTVKSTFDANGNGTIIPISRGITYLKNQDAIDEEGYSSGIRKNLESFLTF
ncbi:orotidine-5'-phosphate decarboxylase [Candidatus Marinamargulisbacteria bacterium SCGC AG-439-L15]|nr:orotidine-5'-phosphate decarboxylase [Candidatus Marinamargulisbacteria bacterium SCGC AG-439-L15]